MHLTSYIDKYGQDVYDFILDEECLVSSRCRLKKDVLEGRIYSLWLAKRDDNVRPNHLWLIEWTTETGEYAMPRRTLRY